MEENHLASGGVNQTILAFIASFSTWTGQLYGENLPEKSEIGTVRHQSDQSTSLLLTEGATNPTVQQYVWVPVICVMIVGVVVAWGAALIAAQSKRFDAITAAEEERFELIAQALRELQDNLPTVKDTTTLPPLDESCDKIRASLESDVMLDKVFSGRSSFRVDNPGTKEQEARNREEKLDQRAAPLAAAVEGLSREREGLSSLEGALRKSAALLCSATESLSRERECLAQLYSSMSGQIADLGEGLQALKEEREAGRAALPSGSNPTGASAAVPSADRAVTALGDKVQYLTSVVETMRIDVFARLTSIKEDSEQFESLVLEKSCLQEKVRSLSSLLAVAPS